MVLHLKVYTLCGFFKFIYINIIFIIKEELNVVCSLQDSNILLEEKNLIQVILILDFNLNAFNCWTAYLKAVCQAI